MKSHRPGPSPREAFPSAFTLVEIMGAMVVLMVILGMIFVLTASTSKLWRSSAAEIGAFQEARVAYERITRNLSQATLNTYWDYDNPQTPTAYLRRSELAFLCGPNSNTLLAPLFSGTAINPTHSIFFEAPLGKSSDAALPPLNQLLNGCGYFLAFGAASNLPAFLTTLIPVRYRYRLVEWCPPSEQFTLYSKTSGVPTYHQTDWISTAPLTTATSGASVLAENIIALVFLPKPSALDTTGVALTTDYSYDSRVGVEAASASQPANQHQLPPLVEVVMVAIDEDSAARLALSAGRTPPALLTSALRGLFADPTRLNLDLQTLETALARAHIRCEVYDTDVSIRAAKWSSN